MAHSGELTIDELQGMLMFERASALLDRPIAALKKMRLDNLITTLERRGDKGAADFFASLVPQRPMTLIGQHTLRSTTPLGNKFGKDIPN